MSSVMSRVAAAPISWGVCEAPGWGLQLPVDRVLDEARQLGITAIEQGALGWLPTDPDEQRAKLAQYGMRMLGGFVPLVLHDAAQREAQLAEADRIAAAERDSPATLLMGFMRRFDAGFLRVAQRIADGDIGEPLLVKSTGRGPGLPPPWAWDSARSGGLVAEVNSHDLDTVRWLSGQEATRVYAVGRAAKRPDLVEDHPGFVDLVALTFELSGGGLAMVDGACPADYGYDARVEVYGSSGVLFAGDPRQHGALLVGAGGASMDAVRSWRDLFAGAYRAEDQHLVAVARGNEPPRTTVDDGVRALEAVVAANTSLREHRPVTVAEVRG